MTLLPVSDIKAFVFVGFPAFSGFGYGVGAQLSNIQKLRFDILWENDDSLSSQYNTPIAYGESLFGIHGREDLGSAELRCIDASTGKVNWRESDFGVAHLVRVDDKILVKTRDYPMQPFKEEPYGRLAAFCFLIHYTEFLGISLIKKCKLATYGNNDRVLI